MDNFFKYFYQDIGLIFKSFVDIISAIFNAINTLFNFPMRMRIIQTYSNDLNVGGWLMVILSNLVLLIVGLIIAFLIANTILGYFNSLRGCQAVYDHFLQSPLHTGISVKAKLHGKTNHCGF